MTPAEYAAKADKLLQKTPKEFWGVMSGIAWDQGHANGYEEVLNVLSELVAVFEEPIREFETRINGEAIDLSMKHR